MSVQRRVTMKTKKSRNRMVADMREDENENEENNRERTKRSRTSAIES